MNIETALSETASYGGFFAIAVGGDPDGWIPVQCCYDDGCADLVRATAERYGATDLRISASLVQFSHASRLWSPILATALGHGVVPDLGGLQRAATSTDLRLPVPRGRAVDRDRPLSEQLYRLVVEDHLEPLAAGLRVKMAPGLLYGNAAAALVAAADQLARARPELRAAAVAAVESLLATGKLDRSGELAGLSFRRRSCCLFYRTPGGSYCGDCALARRKATRQ
ncbi:(2Fe-2S)-binding protein [Mycolicibacterium sp. HK-90]|uniref:(2Fe-2S)-binding protein n=1 Tax=Mycolicibacterium sp. HK-90 TaxID=3056937 RepID=UPI002658C0B3|nr:(2Fe-2S)-binding protein [Mycolicibacterium sp. HK-90]WKG02932.1 (2Fe-2S)-binding protein [Mycolicibacterium sp. HK-90]